MGYNLGKTRRKTGENYTIGYFSLHEQYGTRLIISRRHQILVTLLEYDVTVEKSESRANYGRMIFSSTYLYTTTKKIKGGLLAQWD